MTLLELNYFKGSQYLARIIDSFSPFARSLLIFVLGLEKGIEREE